MSQPKTAHYKFYSMGPRQENFSLMLASLSNFGEGKAKGERQKTAVGQNGQGNFYTSIRLFDRSRFFKIGDGDRNKGMLYVNWANCFGQPPKPTDSSGSKLLPPTSYSFLIWHREAQPFATPGRL